MDVEDRSVFELPYAKPDKTISFGKSEDQVIDFYLPQDQKKPLIVLIHGGYWRPEYDRKHLAPLADALSNSGWPVALIEYRRIIGNPDAMLSDVISAIEEVSKSYPNLILIGHSAGGHLALVASHKFGASAVIALAPLTNLLAAEELDLDEGAVSDFLGTPASLRSDLDPMRLSAPTSPTTIIHGTLDIRVPIAFSRDYFAQKAGPNMHFMEFENLGHFELIDPRSEIFTEISRVLDSLS
jgi:acetyl esterase/lipase